MKWTCDKCGYTLTAEVIVFPMQCVCELVDIGEEARDEQKSRFEQLWKEIHTLKLTNPDADMAKLTAITARLPCGECKRNWPRVLRDDPPPLHDQDEYFEWTWWTHRDHGGDDITLEQAKDIWGC